MFRKKLPQDVLVDLAREDAKTGLRKAEEAYQQAMASPTSLIPDPKAPGGVVSSIRKADKAAQYVLESVTIAVGLLSYRAIQTRQTHERRLLICTWASYFLYALGWGLGLAGRLVGVEGIGNGGD